jgi:HJR/Mrr/RecB family endonuclease
MSKVKFAGRDYYSELHRSRDAYNNESHLTQFLKLKKKRMTRNGVLFSLGIGLYIGLLCSSWSIIILVFILAAILFSIIIHLYIENQINLIGEYAENYSEKIIRLKQDFKHKLIEPFLKRYITPEQIEENIPDLVNLINHRKELNLINDDIELMIGYYEWEKFEEKINSSIAKLDHLTTANIARMLLENFQETDFGNDNEINELLMSFEDYQEGNTKYCDIDILKKEIIFQYKSRKAIQFEKKLSRNNSGGSIILEVENMDGFEFEDFLAGLYKKAGYKVFSTPKSGDQGADLIIEKDGFKIAVQAKKYSGKVNNKAVQEVVAAMKYYDCDKAMVITTGFFTKGATDLAERNNVTLKNKTALNILIDSIL